MSTVIGSIRAPLGEIISSILLAELPNCVNVKYIGDFLLRDRFEGEKCEKCDDLKCHNKGVCSMSDGAKRCSCSAGFSGSTCEDDLCQGYCKSGTCIHGFPPRCQCPAGKTGIRCHLDNKDCACRNNGTCIKDNSDHCVCADGFYGTLLPASNYAPNITEVSPFAYRAKLRIRHQLRCTQVHQWRHMRVGPSLPLPLPVGASRPPFSQASKL